MVQILLLETRWLILLMTHSIVSVKPFTLYKVGGLYLKTKSPLVVEAVSRSICAVRCKEFPKCHGFSFFDMECVIGDSIRSWKKVTTRDNWETWMQLPLSTHEESAAKMSCPSDFVYDQGINFCFKLLAGSVKYEHSRRLCAQAVNGGKLVSLDEPSKHQTLKKYITARGGNFGWVRIAGQRNSPTADFVLENGHVLPGKGDAWCSFRRAQGNCLALNTNSGSCIDIASCLAYQDCVCEKTK